MIPFNNRLFPEAMLFNLKAIQTVDSGLLRLTLQIKCDKVNVPSSILGLV